MVLAEEPHLNTSCGWHSSPLLPENLSVAQGTEQPTYGENLSPSSLATNGVMGEGVPQREGEGRESEEYYFLISVLQLRKGCVFRFHVPQLPPAACSHPQHVCRVFVTTVASGSMELGPSIH